MRFCACIVPLHARGLTTTITPQRHQRQRQGVSELWIVMYAQMLLAPAALFPEARLSIFVFWDIYIYMCVLCDMWFCIHIHVRACGTRLRTRAYITHHEYIYLPIPLTHPQHTNTHTPPHKQINKQTQTLPLPSSSSPLFMSDVLWASFHAACPSAIPDPSDGSVRFLLRILHI